MAHCPSTLLMRLAPLFLTTSFASSVLASSIKPAETVAQSRNAKLRKVVTVEDTEPIYPTPPIRISPIENVEYRTYQQVREVNTGEPGMHIIIEVLRSRRPSLRLSAYNRLGEDLALVRFQLIIDFVDGKEIEGLATLGPVKKNESKAIVLALPPGIVTENIYYYFLRELQLMPQAGGDIPPNSLKTMVHYKRTRFAKSPPPLHPDRKPGTRVR